LSCKTKPLSDTPVEVVLNNTWRAALAILGADGIPTTNNAGTAILPQLKLKLALRIPRTSNAAIIVKELKTTLEVDPPHNATVNFTLTSALRNPWCCSSAIFWTNKLKQAAKIYYGMESMAIGCGAGIGAVSTLAECFPDAEIVISGIDAPECNAHSPNEFVHIPTAKKYTCCLAEVLSL